MKILIENFFTEENALQNVVCKIATILSGLQGVDHDVILDAFDCSLTCLNASMISLDSSMSLNMPSNLLVKPPPHSETYQHTYK